ncbi:hypothetical protein GE061_011895, partial [Apolygus lucorum]
MVAESYDDLDELASQNNPNWKIDQWRVSGVERQKYFFYNMYALLAGSIVHTEKYNK